MLVFYLIVGVLLSVCLLGAPSALELNKFLLVLCCIGMILIWPLVLVFLDAIVIKSFINHQALFDPNEFIKSNNDNQDTLDKQ